MNTNRFSPTNREGRRYSPLALLIAATVLVLAGLLFGRLSAPSAPATAAKPAAGKATAEAKVLYWYDPMRPEQHFDQPGKSPFMDMELIPKFADADVGADAGETLRIDPLVAQNLGMRLATAVAYADSEQTTAAAVVATGLLGFNERQVAVLQTRSAGFVEWVKPLAEGDLVVRGEAVARLLLPDWVALQQELLALQANGDPALLAAGRERLAAAGMSRALIDRVLASATIDNRIALNAPIGGVVTEVGLRAGMSAAAGTTVLAIRDLDEVWLEVAVPEAAAGGLAIGDPALVQFAALPGRSLPGTIQWLLPTLDAAARSLRVRVVLANPGHQLRPGMSAQVQLLTSRLPTAAARPAGAVVVPAAAVIDSGQRALVMLAEGLGRYRPQIVVAGAELGDQRVILSGLKAGQKVVASGQFLVDSEASLQGLLLRAEEKPHGGPDGDDQGKQDSDGEQP